MNATTSAVLLRGLRDAPWVVVGIVGLIASGALLGYVDRIEPSSGTLVGVATFDGRALAVVVEAAQARETGDLSALEAVIADSEARSDVLQDAIREGSAAEEVDARAARLLDQWAALVDAAFASQSSADLAPVAGAADEFMASLDDLRADIEGAQARSFAGLRRALWLAAMTSVVAIATIAFGPARSFVRRARERDLSTGLLRATRFEESLVAFARDARPRQTYVVGFVPERIEEVRRTLGPTGADQVLGSLGRRLQRNAGPGALVARSGDALMVAIAAADVDRAVARTRDLLVRLNRPIAVGSVQVHTRLYAGVTAIEEGPANIGDSPLAGAAGAAEQARLTGADVAVREAGAEQPVNGFAFEAELLQALRRREFVVHYQPVFDLETWEVVGAEALLRWESPKHGTVGPTLFVPALEACGLIGEVGRWVLETALEDARVFRAVASSGFRLSVNAAAPEVTAPGFVAGVLSRLERAGIPPSGLEIEITESVAIADKRLLRAALTDLRDSGIRCSLDDFGTGKSQLADLRELPWDTIKIDRQFVQALPDDRFALSIVRTLVDAAREMGRTVVAEGIETHEQASAMRQLGSHLGQGYLVSKPIPAARLRQLLHASAPGEPRRPCGIVALAS